MEPPVSEPNAKKHSLAATAAAEPPEEPPGTCCIFLGFLVTPKAEVSKTTKTAEKAPSVRSARQKTAPASKAASSSQTLSVRRQRR